MNQEEEAIILATIWHRDRLVIQSEDLKNANDAFFELSYFIPQYRQLVLCGDIPKGARYLKGAKLLETDDISSLREAFQSSLAEEELGTPPVQIVYFNASEEVLQNVLKNLDRGWIATSSRERKDFVRKMFKPKKEISFNGKIIYLLDDLSVDYSIEKKLLEDTKNSSKGIKQFIIQMKQSEVHLAFQAIQDELKTRKNVTQSYLSETLGIREKTLRKIIETGIRERKLDISDYIVDTPPLIVEFLKEISQIKEVSLVAVFKDMNLIAYARYREIGFPTMSFLQLKKNVENLQDSKLEIGEYWHLRLNALNKDIFLYNHDYFYCFVLEKGLNFITFRAKIEKLVKYI